MIVKFIDEAINFKNSEKVKIRNLTDKLTDKRTRGMILRNDGDEDSFDYMAAELRPIYNDFTQTDYDAIIIRIREDDSELKFKKGFESAKEAIKEFQALRKVFSDRDKTLKFLNSHKYEKFVKHI